MKRISILISLLFVFCFANTTLAKEPFSDAQALYNDWETNGYPDDVGNVYFDDATSDLVITLVNPTEARKQEIFGMIKTTAHLSFGESQYAYNDMLKVQKEIEAEVLSKKKNISGVGIGWRIDGDKVTGFGPSGKEARVVVTVDPGMLEEYTKTLRAQYGDMVYVESGSAPVPLDSANSANKQKLIPWVWPVSIAMLFVIACAAYITARRRLVLVMQTSHGTTIAQAQRLNNGMVIQAVKGSTFTPSDAVFYKIKEKL